MCHLSITLRDETSLYQIRKQSSKTTVTVTVIFVLRLGQHRKIHWVADETWLTLIANEYKSKSFVSLFRPPIQHMQ